MSQLETVFKPHTLLMRIKSASVDRIMRISNMSTAGEISQEEAEECFSVLGKLVAFISDVEISYRKSLELYSGHLSLSKLCPPRFTVEVDDNNIASMVNQTAKVIKLLSDYATIEIDGNPHKSYIALKSLVKTSKMIYPVLEKKIDLLKQIEEKIYAIQQQKKGGIPREG